MEQTKKCLSIITNFGCHMTCPYCVVKNNNINVPATTIESLDFLKAAVEFERATKVSVSGGGDPLHEYPKHKDYYDKLFKLCEEMDIPLDIHTSYIKSEFPYERCNRVVYHCHNRHQLKNIRRHGNEKIRVVFVVTEDFSHDKIFRIADQVLESTQIDELSFRQMIDDKYQATTYCQDFLRRYHGVLWHYIEQDDYNSYFVNGDIYYKFADIGTINAEDLLVGDE